MFEHTVRIATFLVRLYEF